MGCSVLLLPLVAVCVAVPASGQLPQIWPLDVTLTAERIGDKAAGAVTVINPTKGPIEVGKLIFRVLFFDEQRVQKDDIRQNLVVRKCGATKLPATLAQDDDVVCPFTTADNVYHGAIQITAGAVRATEPDDSFSGDALGMDMVDWLTPAGSDDAGGTDTIASSTNTGSAGSSSDAAPGFTAIEESNIPGGAHAGGSSDDAAPGFTANADSNIPGHDIACGQTDGEGKPATFCRTCGGISAVRNACQQQPECVAFDMQGADCGYLKSSAGPFKQPAPGFTSYVRVPPAGGAHAVGSSDDAAPGFTANADSNIPGHDIACGQADGEGNPAAFCRTCEGISAVWNACQQQPECVAFDMEGADCGYLK
uniref:MD-2-related lipid-recognition domain-containing protein n=1 Tax=Tetradesmus obliquus TaxID=3088 RepID=A0A383V9A2_TETOB|eukprot:jgi/Sobl393_1/6462/SZX61352.1